MRPRLEAFRFLQFSLGSTLATQLRSLRTVREACEQMVTSTTTADGALGALLARVLAVGNAINAGHRVFGGAGGFALESLLELGRAAHRHRPARHRRPSCDPSLRSPSTSCPIDPPHRPRRPQAITRPSAAASRSTA